MKQTHGTAFVTYNYPKIEMGAVSKCPFRYHSTVTSKEWVLCHNVHYQHCVKSVRIWNYSGPHFPAFGLNAERYGISLRIKSKCEKMQTGITPNADAFHAVQLSKDKCSSIISLKKFSMSKDQICLCFIEKREHLYNRNCLIKKPKIPYDFDVYCQREMDCSISKMKVRSYFMEKPDRSYNLIKTPKIYNDFNPFFSFIHSTDPFGPEFT